VSQLCFDLLFRS